MERDSERQRKRERHRETDRQTDRQRLRLWVGKNKLYEIERETKKDEV